MTSRTEIAHHAEQKMLAYYGLAKAYARNDNAWMAVHAQMMSDLAAAEKVLRYHNIPVIPFLDAVGQIVRLDMQDSSDTSEISRTVRTGILACLPEKAQEEWEASLPSLEYLYSCVPVDYSQIEVLRRNRLQGSTVEQTIDRLRGIQGRQIEEANAQWERGDVWKASSEAYDADLTGYEAWLMQRSIALGDTDFVQCELLWGIGCAALEQLTNLPPNPKEAVFLIRSRLAWALTPQEATSLAVALKGLTFA